jgi:hypothetical protein
MHQHDRWISDKATSSMACGFRANSGTASFRYSSATHTYRGRTGACFELFGRFLSRDDRVTKEVVVAMEAHKEDAELDLVNGHERVRSPMPFSMRWTKPFRGLPVLLFETQF